MTMPGCGRNGDAVPGNGMAAAEAADFPGFSSSYYFSLFFKCDFGVPSGRCKR